MLSLRPRIPHVAIVDDASVSHLSLDTIVVVLAFSALAVGEGLLISLLAMLLSA